MARYKKQDLSAASNSSNSSSIFEEIDLTSNLPADFNKNEEIDLSGAVGVITALPQTLQAAKQKLEEQLIFNVVSQALAAEAGTDSYGYENIVGVGISEKMTNNQFTGVPCVTVYVVTKASQSKISEEAMVPKEVDGVPTDVIATGEIRANALTGRYRPAPGGVSVGHYQITAGTLGCLVQKNGQLFILSNNHVLANVNTGHIGDPIVQPGPYDGGVSAINVIARLSQFIPVQLGDSPNLVDCAIAQTNSNLVTAQNYAFGTIKSNPNPAQRFMVVKKCGRSTEGTYGLVTDVNATIRVGYGNFGTAIFQDQMIIAGVPFIAPFSAPGDSGSLIMDLTNRPMGLLFAGSNLFTIGNKIENVLSALGVNIVS